MAVGLEKQARRWTYEEYYRLDDGQRYEIIEGNLLTSPAPDTWHQNWLNDINLFLTQYVRQNKIGQTFIAPIDVVLDNENTVQPDFVYVKNSNVVERRGIFGVPDLLVEVVSPTSVRRDRYDKKDLYARFGVKEYWIADPANQSLEILTLRDGRYELHCSAEISGKLTSLVLPGLEFDLAQIH